MNAKLLCISWVLWIGSALGAPVLPPEQLLPPDTLVVLTIPDYSAASSAWKSQALVRLWNDPALQPFRRKFEDKWREEILRPLEQELGVQLTNSAQLLQGQITLAVVRNGWPTTSGNRPGWVLALDARDRSPLLAEQMSLWKSRLAESGETLRSERIRDVEFNVVSVKRPDVAGALDTGVAPGEDAEEPTMDLWFGQSGSLLWVGDQRAVLEQLLARQSGGGDESLKSNPDFATAYGPGLALAQAYGWVHLKPLMDYLVDPAGGSAGGGDGAMALLEPSKLLPALGLRDLRSASFALRTAADGTSAEVRIGIPESARTGLFKLLIPGQKEAAPPDFVSAETSRFQRLRLNLPEAWASLEGMVYSILPTARGVVDLMLQSVGKDKDPNYDLRTELFGNLGDDLMVIEQRPASDTVAAMASQPSLILLGSKAPDRMVEALRMVAALLPAPMNELQQREVDGGKIYSLTLPQTVAAGEDGTALTFSFGSGADYLAMSEDSDLLSAFLRRTGSSEKPLSALAGLKEAAEKIGGMNQGWFGYENEKAVAQAAIEALRNDSESIEEMLALTPAGEAIQEGGGLKAWVDFELLPPFETIAKYFHFTVYGLNMRPEDFSYLMFSPTPPGLQSQ